VHQINFCFIKYDNPELNKPQSLQNLKRILNIEKEEIPPLEIKEEPGKTPEILLNESWSKSEEP
jgi:hypothetical protein